MMSHPWGTQVKPLLHDPLEQGSYQGAAQGSLFPAEHIWLSLTWTPQLDLTTELPNATSPL